VASVTPNITQQAASRPTGGPTGGPTERWAGGNVPLLAVCLLALLALNVVAKPTTVTLVTPDRSNSDE
jgi:hypothetical protein